MPLDTFRYACARTTTVSLAWTLLSRHKAARISTANLPVQFFSMLYFEKHVAGDDSGRHMVMWEYDSLADYEAYKARRKDYEGPYKEYKENDPYYKGVFIHSRMRMEFWKDRERDLWIE